MIEEKVTMMPNNIQNGTSPTKHELSYLSNLFSKEVCDRIEKEVEIGTYEPGNFWYEEVERVLSAMMYAPTEERLRDI